MRTIRNISPFYIVFISSSLMINAEFSHFDFELAFRAQRGDSRGVQYHRRGSDVT